MWWPVAKLLSGYHGSKTFLGVTDTNGVPGSKTVPGMLSGKTVSRVLGDKAVLCVPDVKTVSKLQNGKNVLSFGKNCLENKSGKTVPAQWWQWFYNLVSIHSCRV